METNASQYTPPDQFQSKPSVHFQGPSLKNNPAFIQLNKVESEIKEFKALNLYLTLVLVYITYLLIKYLFFTTNVGIEFKIIRVIQFLGYTYGIAAYSSKSQLQWQIFCIYMFLSFLIIAYFLYYYFSINQWYEFGTNVVNIPFNIILLHYCKKFLDKLKKRDTLKLQLKEIQSEFDEKQKLYA